ncbi:MAG: CRISPR-associated protein Csx15 [Egibacteraceae bacterium]
MRTARSPLVCNFSHPLTHAHVEQLEALLGVPVDAVIERPTVFDPGTPFAEQARRLVDAVGLSVAEWQTRPIVVHLPGHSVIAALVLAELHGRTGGFPAVLRLRRLEPLNEFTVAELIDLQAVREAGRGTRMERR